MPYLREDLITKQADTRNDVEGALPLVSLRRVLAGYFRLVHLVENNLYRIN